MEVIEITDSHCHLDFKDFNDDLDVIVQRALTAGVSKMITICTKLVDEPKVRLISEKYKSVYYAAGTHPMSAASVPLVTENNLLELSKHAKFVGIGETGLDYYYTSESADIQKESLYVHIEAARQSRLPLIIHSRAADEDMIKILKSEYKAGPFKCVMHCFSSSQELAITALELGFFLSMSGIVAFPKSSELRDIFSKAPVEKVLIETDSPYLAPPPYRGQRNEPSYSVYTAKVGAEIFDMDYATFAIQTQRNFNKLFSKAVS